MEKLVPSVEQIRSSLENSQHVKLVGEFEVLSIPQYNPRLNVRRDFYVEPMTPPVFSELTDSQVDALNAAAYYKQTPTKELTTIFPGNSQIYIIKFYMICWIYPKNSILQFF